jgi:hypothetical protein
MSIHVTFVQIMSRTASPDLNHVPALPQDLISATLMTKRELEQRRVDLLGVLVNRVDRGNMHGLSRECSKVFADNGIPVCALLPAAPLHP